MADCKKCRFRSICKKRPKMEGATIAECDLFRNDIERTEPITNADRIRSMTDEELAEYISLLTLCRYDSYKTILEWLQQPVEVKDNA